MITLYNSVVSIMTVISIVVVVIICISGTSSTSISISSRTRGTSIAIIVIIINGAVRPVPGHDALVRLAEELLEISLYDNMYVCMCIYIYIHNCYYCHH